MSDNDTRNNDGQRVFGWVMIVLIILAICSGGGSEEVYHGFKSD